MSITPSSRSSEPFCGNGSSLRDRYGIVTSYLGATLRRFGRPGYIQSIHSDDVFCASFRSEDAARAAMAWVEPDLTEIVVKRQGGLWTLSGIIEGHP